MTARPLILTPLWLAAALILAGGRAAAQGPATGAALPIVRGTGDAAKDHPEFAARSGGGPIEYLWVPRTALVEPGCEDSLVSRALAMGVRGLLVQVVGRGDAYYRSSILPRAQALGPRSSEDPLGDLVARASQAGLEVHAWMNCMLVWSARERPRDPRHVVRAHPEWLAALRNGRRLGNLGPRERRKLKLEGEFLAPAHPAVAEWLASIAAEIATRYPVDGIHLDYIRLPGVKVGGDATSRARFAMRTGIDPARLPTTGPRGSAVEASWNALHRDAITSAVRRVRDTLRVVRPDISLSAAVLSHPDQAERICAQDWRAWVRDSLVDRAFPMAYAPEVQTVLDQLVAHREAVGSVERIVPGIAIYNSGPAAAAHKIKAAKALGYPAVALYDYESLFKPPSRWPALFKLLAGLKADPADAENKVQALPDSSANP